MDGNVFQKFDTLITAMMSPAVAAASGAFVREAAQRRIAALCIGIRLYEKRNGKMPTSLDDLKSLELGELTLDLAALLPPGGKPFGYRVEDDQVLVWGFDANQASETPSKPPPIEDGVPHAEMNKIWIWRLETKRTE